MPAADSCTKCQSKDVENWQLKLKILKMEKELEKAKVERFGLERLAANDSQMAYYTGLPSYGVFKCLFSFLEPSLVAIHGKHGRGKHLEGRLSPYLMSYSWCLCV